MNRSGNPISVVATTRGKSRLSPVRTALRPTLRIRPKHTAAGLSRILTLFPFKRPAGKLPVIGHLLSGMQRYADNFDYAKKKLRNLEVEKLRNLEVLEEIVGCTITDKPGPGREFFVFSSRPRLISESRFYIILSPSCLTSKQAQCRFGTSILD